MVDNYNWEKNSDVIRTGTQPESTQTNTTTSSTTRYFELRPLDSAHIHPRKTYFNLSDEIPKLWFQNSSIMTHFVNGINLFVSVFELFMARTLKIQLHAIQDPFFKQQVCGFIGQEVNHSAVHEKYNRVLRKQGYYFDSFSTLVRLLFDQILGRLGLKIGLTTIAGFEHLTATLAEVTLRYNILETAHPTMKYLWQWHAAEELEHKTLAFDVLQSVDRNYWLRIFGLVLGTVIVFGLSISAMILLALQDPNFLSWKTISDGVKLFFTEYQLIPRCVPRVLTYFRPDFYPSHQETDQYAQQVFTTTFH